MTGEATATDLAVTDERALAAPPECATQQQSFLERAALDTSIDLDRLKQVMEIQRGLDEAAAKRAYIAAMAAAQAEMAPISADAKNDQTKSKYASYAALDAAMRPAYTKHGFTVEFGTEPSESPDVTVVVCEVSHIEGHSKKERLPVPCDGKGPKGNDVMTKTHATLSAITYGRSALLKMAFNLSVSKAEGDDDGNAATAQEYITAGQRDQISDLINETGSDIAKFCTAFQIEALPDLPLSKFGSALKMLETKKARN